MNSCRLEYVAFCKQQSLQAIYSRTGKKLTSQEFDRLVADDSHKEKEVIQARLENIRLQTVIEKKEALVKQKVDHYSPNAFNVAITVSVM